VTTGPHQGEKTAAGKSGTPDSVTGGASGFDRETLQAGYRRGGRHGNQVQKLRPKLQKILFL
jgi:hypothetical protein